jgi:hypothetical protein
MLNYLNPILRKNIIEEMKAQENMRRKSNSLKQFEIFKDRLYAYVKQYLEGFYSTATINNMPIVASINLAKRIVDQEARIYSNEPDRRFINVTEEQSKALECLYEFLEVNTYMKRANQYYRLQDQTAIQVKLVNGKLKLINLMGHTYDVVPNPDDIESPDCYILTGFDRLMWAPRLDQFSDSRNETIADSDDYRSALEAIAWWSPQFNFITDKDGNITSEETVNPLGDVIPFIDIAGCKDNEYFVRSGNSITDFTIQFNGTITDVQNVIRMQGFGQAWYKGAQGSIPQNIQVGPNFVLKLPVDPNNPVDTAFGFANSSADIGGSITFLEMLLSTFLTSRGLDPKVISAKGEAAKFTSGFDRLLYLIEAFEPSKADFKVFKNVEKKLFNILKTYINTYSGTGLLMPKCDIGPIPEDADVEITFSPPEAVVSETERLDNVQKKLDLGVITQLEAIEEARQVTEDEAKEIQDEIKAETAGLPEPVENPKAMEEGSNTPMMNGKAMDGSNKVND